MSREQEEFNVDEMNQELLAGLREANLSGSSSVHEHGQRKKKWRSSGKEKRRNKKKKKKSLTKRKVFLTVLMVILGIFILAVAALLFMRMKGESSMKESKTSEEITAPKDAQIESDGKIVVYKGERYCYNEDNINILCMGVDKSIQETSDASIGENGQADTLLLAVLNSRTGDISLVNISRDSMVDVDEYNFQGNFLGTSNMQICLAYSYGDGKSESCENTMKAVSRLLYGMPIHAYAAIDYDGISVLNDAVGGVEVEVLEDLTKSDPQLAKGNVLTLQGNQAHTYVRSRNTALLDSNNMRMERQKQYLFAFINKTLTETRANATVPLTLYQAVSDYMVTDIAPSEVTYLASLLLQKGFSMDDMQSVPGEVRDGGKYAEFIPDDTGLYELILDVFYEKAD